MADQLIDAGALMIVLAGTLLATLARCGWHDLGAAITAIAGLARRGFDADANRAALARGAHAIRLRGHLCADIPAPPDPGMARLLDVYARSGSIETMHDAARTQQTERTAAAMRGVQALEYAGELAPVFGLVGTLFAITQSAPDVGSLGSDATMGAIATAVLSSLYGVLTAHLVWIPLARATDRRSQAEERTRQALIDWFAGEVGRYGPQRLRVMQGAA